MPSHFSSLQITLWDEGGGYATNVDITPDVKSIPIFTDTGSGEVNEATIILNAPDGDYITTGNIVDKFDRIRIACTDVVGTTYDRFFEIDELIPSETKGEGTLLQLECLGIEYHTQNINYIKPHFFVSGFNVGKDIGDFYEDNNGSRQPLIDKHNVVYSTVNKTGNELPKFTVNNYEYGLNEDSVYNRQMDVNDKFGASVSAGGIRDFLELSYDTLTVNQIDLAQFISGARSFDGNDPTNDASAVSIINAKSINPLGVGEQEGEIANPSATNILAWGSPNHGSLPTGHSKYVSGLFQFFFRPVWDSTLSYKTDARVKHLKKHYKSNIDNNTSTPPTNWTQIDMSDEFGDDATKKYSFWTDDKAALWKNCGADPKGTNARSCFDSNIIIWDDNFFRTWVNSIATTNANLDTLASDGLSDGWSYTNTDRTTFPPQFRVLVGATPSGVFAQNSGKDINNQPFKNNIVAFVGGGGAKASGTEWKNWQVKYNITVLDAEADKIQCAVIDQSKIFEWTQGSLVWTDISGNGLANDCFHPYVDITNVEGVDLIPVGGTGYQERADVTDTTDYPEITKDGLTFDENKDSAVQVEYSPGVINAIATAAITGDINAITHSFYKVGAWLNFQFPFPPNTFNTISESVGKLYGGTATNPVPVLDTGNMRSLSDGTRGFNQGVTSEEYGPINALGCMFKVDATNPLTGKADGEYNCRCALIDTSDNVVVQDFTIRFVDNWQEIILPLSGFSIYRAHKPLYGFHNSIPDMITPKEIDIQNLFEWRNLKFVVFQLQDFYDEHGRYNPTSVEDIDNIAITKVIGSSLKIIVDDFRWVKPLLVTSGQDTTRNIEKFIQRPFITLYDQLKNDALTQLEIEKFRHKQFDIRTVGDNTFDIRFGDTFFLENTNLVTDANRTETSLNADDGDAGTIRLVAKRIEYSITKPQAGQGGLERRIIGSKRFT